MPRGEGSSAFASVSGGLGGAGGRDRRQKVPNPQRLPMSFALQPRKTAETKDPLSQPGGRRPDVSGRAGVSPWVERPPNFVGRSVILLN